MVRRLSVQQPCTGHGCGFLRGFIRLFPSIGRDPCPCSQSRMMVSAAASWSSLERPSLCGLRKASRPASRSGSSVDGRWLTQRRRPALPSERAARRGTRYSSSKRMPITQSMVSLGQDEAAPPFLPPTTIPKHHPKLRVKRLMLVCAMEKHSFRTDDDLRILHRYLVWRRIDSTFQ